MGGDRFGLHAPSLRAVSEGYSVKKLQQELQAEKAAVEARLKEVSAPARSLVVRCMLHTHRAKKMSSEGGQLWDLACYATH
eukprot:960044-Rhodomonas_salina.2